MRRSAFGSRAISSPDSNNLRIVHRCCAIAPGAMLSAQCAGGPFVGRPAGQVAHSDRPTDRVPTCTTRRRRRRTRAAIAAIAVTRRIESGRSSGAGAVAVAVAVAVAGRYRWGEIGKRLAGERQRSPARPPSEGGPVILDLSISHCDSDGSLV